jgi:hypothetical protein
MHGTFEMAPVAFCAYVGASINGSANPYSSKEWASENDKELARCVATLRQSPYGGGPRDRGGSGRW